jgi:sporulation protein YlmC with PRC-barrel domain
MTDTQFTIGADASCSEGVCGKVSRVVVDPVARAVTHLVVEPKDSQGIGRLVPLGLVEASNGTVHMRCTAAEFDKLDPAEETEFLPGVGGGLGYRRDQVWGRPYYGMGMGAMGGLGMGAMGMGGLGIGGMGTGNPAQSVTHDMVPSAEVSVRRGERVHATDGEIGKVQGLVIDPRDHHVTHVLLQEGHLWGRKEVTIPISAVAAVDDGIRLNIAKGEVEKLPPVEIDHPGVE